MPDDPPRRRRVGFRLRNLFRKLKVGRAYLQFMYYDPVKQADRPFPDGTPITVIYHEANGNVRATQTGFQISGGKGKLSFKIEAYADDENEKYLSVKIRFPDEEPRFLNMTSKKLMTESELHQDMADQGRKYLSSKMFFSLPREIGFRDARWGVDCNLYDNNLKYFTVRYDQALKGDNGHAPLILQPEWQYLSFRYRKPFKDEEGFVPQGFLIEGFINNDKVVRSDVYIDECHLVPWIKCAHMAAPPAGTPARNFEHVRLEFAAPDTFVKADGKLLISKKPDDIWKKPLKERYDYFDLPADWKSTNWMVQIENDTDEFKMLVNRETTAGEPMKVFLDSVTFTDGALDSLAWNGDNRLTAFNIKLAIQNPDTDRPYWYKDKFATNCILPFAGDKLPRRVMALKGDFYDVTHKRSATGSVIGARAAVLDDADVHHGEELLSPVVNKAGFTAGVYVKWGEIGNFELHYLSECFDDNDEETPKLLLHWSCRFVKPKAGLAAGTVPQPHDSATVDLAAGNDADTNIFRKNGFANAKTRWEKKKYTFIPKKDPKKKKLTVYPVFFFEGREETDAIGPNGWPPNPPAHLINKPYKCTTLLHAGASGRSDMGSFFANFMKNTHQPQPASGSTNEDGTYAWFTMSHELGHAVGLHDEYLESNEQDLVKYATLATDKAAFWNPVLPAVKQWYHGMPYSCDKHTMMNSNKAPRLRHFWYFCRWLNELRNHADKKVKALVSDTVFQVHGEWKAKKKKYKYYLEKNNSLTNTDKGINFYEPYYNDSNFPQASSTHRKYYDKKHRAHASNGHLDLILYKMGDDETRELIIETKPGFDGILVVRTKLLVKFKNYVNAADHTKDQEWPDDAAITQAGDDKKMPAKLRYLRAFQSDINTILNQRFYLTHRYDKEFRQIYVYFLPHYKLAGQAGATDFEMTVERNTTANVRYEADFRADGFASTNFTIDQKQSPVSVLRYMLGLKPYNVTGTKKVMVGAVQVKQKIKQDITDISANDLRFLARWVKSERGNKLRHRVKSVNKV